MAARWRDLEIENSKFKKMENKVNEEVEQKCENS